MCLDKTIRTNLNGEYIIIYTNYLEEGIKYAKQIKIPQIQLRSSLGNGNKDMNVDFKLLEQLSKSLITLSVSDELENIINVESIYALENLQTIFFNNKQKVKIDISKFPKIRYLGTEYWKGLTNIGRAYSLQSLLLTKYPNTDLEEISRLKALQVLHLYRSKIENLEGIENLPLIELALVRNNNLKDIKAVLKLNRLKKINIEKCKKIEGYELINKENIDIKIIK